MLDYVYSPCAVPQNDFGGRATWGATFGGYAVSILSPTTCSWAVYADYLVRAKMGRAMAPMSRMTYRILNSSAQYSTLHYRGIAGSTTYGVAKRSRLIAVKAFSDTG